MLSSIPSLIFLLCISYHFFYGRLMLPGHLCNSVLRLKETKMFINHRLSIYPSIHSSIQIHPPIYLSIHLFINPFINSSNHLFVYPSMHPCTHAFTHPSVRPSVRPSVHPSVRPSIHPSIHPSTHLSINSTSLPVYLSYSVCLSPSLSLRTDLLDQLI